MKRASEALLEEYLRTFPCVAILGVRQCGKTTLLGTLPKSWTRIDLERRADHSVVARDPDLFLRLNARHVAIDEAQQLPELFPALRVAIDGRRAEKGRYVITGSSSPALVTSISESLAGRVGLIELAPFSFAEVTRSATRDSLLARLCHRRAKPRDLVDGLKPRGSLETLHDFWFRGGFPEPWLNPGERFRTQWTEQYIQTYLYRDVKRLFPGLDDVRFRRFLELLGGLSGKVLNYADTARALNVSQPTARDYFEIAHGTFVWRRVSAFSRSSVKRVVKHPRGYLRDTGLLHTLLRIPDLDALQSHPQVGASWEGLIVEEILRQLEALGMRPDYSFYRTGAGAEVDLVLEGDFGLVAVEVKHTSSVTSRDLRGLHEFIGEHKARLGIVVNSDVAPRVYDDRIIGVPANWL
ncbi:MAG: ATP-binding protein [Vicinamibacterales bacterium]